MAYLLLIMEEPGQRATRSGAEGREVFDRMAKWGTDLKRQGKLKAMESLASPNQDSVRVQVRAGKPSLVDGPFAEAKEMVGGFFLLDGVTREEAVALAKECPAAQWATVEVRQLGPCYT
ncbi:YciI family protein [Ramlibacter humi]|uniref:Dehydrogenase n=1 Tax=Ramlibacter humi TaxID=2530451 RepID=A0A4Z0C0W1_9BURK|nr:YciI family protein [Ramlibacter humi]TFZ03879.1 dehydrogenase [Ramlibacter humi]